MAISITRALLEPQLENLLLEGIRPTIQYMTREVQKTGAMGYIDALNQNPRNFWQFRRSNRPEREIIYLQAIYGIGYDIGRRKLEREDSFPLRPVKTVKPTA